MLRKNPNTKPCCVEGCERPSEAQGRCGMHYHRARRTGEIVRLRHDNTGDCSLDDCGRPAYSQMLCEMHYRRARRYARTGRKHKRGWSCSIEGCDGQGYALKLCKYHYRRKRDCGDPLKPARPNVPFNESDLRRMHLHLDSIPIGGRSEQGSVVDLALIIGRDEGAVHSKLSELRKARQH